MKEIPSKLSVERVYTKTSYGKVLDTFEDDSEKVEVFTFQDVPTASVSVKAGLTKNLGDFNSIRIDVMVTVPSYLEEIDAATAVANAKVEAALEPTLAEFEQILKDRGLI